MDNINSTNSSNLDENVENVSESENAEEENDKGDRNDDDMVCLSVEASKEKQYKSLRNNVELKFKKKSDGKGNLIVITGVNGAGKTHFLQGIARDVTNALLTTRNSAYDYFHNRLCTIGDIYHELEDILREIYKHSKRPHSWQNCLFNEDKEEYKVRDSVLIRLLVYMEGLFFFRRGGAALEITEFSKREITEFLKALNLLKIEHIENYHCIIRDSDSCKKILIILEEIFAKTSAESRGIKDTKKITKESEFEQYIQKLFVRSAIEMHRDVVKALKSIISYHIFEILNLEEDINSSIKKCNISFKYKFTIVGEEFCFTGTTKLKTGEELPINLRFEELSSGEKMIFELICYATFCKMLNIKYLLFDEFDASLNPQLAESYIKTVREVLLKSGITVVLTTHSPSTVIEVEPDELWWMSRMRRDDGSEEVELKSAENKGGKVKILDFLAPRFTPSEDAAKLTYSAIPNGSIVIFVEGESDLAFFEAVNEKMESISKKNRYHFCYLGGITRASYITFMLQNFPNNLKKIIFMLDSDNAGCEAIVNFLENKIKDQDFKKKFVTENNIFLTLIQSSDGDTGEYKLEEMIKDIMEETSRNGSSPLKCNFILLLLKEKWKMMKIMKVINILVLSNKSSSKDGVELIKDIINYSCDELKGAYESKVSSLKGCDIENWNELIQDCKEEDKEKLEKAGKELVGFIGAIVKHLNEVIDYFGQLNGDSKDISAATSNRKKINWKEIEGTINTSCVGTINNIIANLEEIKNDKKGKQLEGNTEKWDEAIELIKIVANGTTSELNKEVMKTIIPSDPMTSEPVKRQFDWINSIIEYSEGKQEKFGKEVKISKKGRNVKIVTRK
ncbi:AAA family ATPase [Candidatus Fokinia crypta]|uniref:AAA domain protein n=1 Tax=Candidatus Fokinia crypta TaxID=1920990 RepID=A0ABZ0URP3_9RICK|nr:AAA family ATPase [Candidatus Fokinia cryptica]WPX97818.1 Putative AAA domain protein [Candidatus Fokinia cryptica]